MRRSSFALPLLALLFAGCWTLPSGAPPPGTITSPENAPETYDQRGAFNYFVTSLLPVLAACEPRPALVPEGPQARELIETLAPLTGCRLASPESMALRLRSELSASSWSVILICRDRELYRQTVMLH